MRKVRWLGSLPSLWHQSQVLPSSQKVAAAAHPDSSQVLRWRQPLSLRKLLELTEYGLHYHFFILQDTILTDSWSSDLSLPPFLSPLHRAKKKNEPACSYSWHLKFCCVVFVVLLPVLRWKMGNHRLYGVNRVFIFTRGHPLRLLSVVWRWSSPLREEYDSSVGKAAISVSVMDWHCSEYVFRYIHPCLIHKKVVL